MNQASPSNDERYFFVFHGDVPSIFMAGVACRRTGNKGAREHCDRKIIKCPYCTEVLTDVDKDTKVELYRYPARKQIRCHAYPVCHSCGNEVGMILR